MMLTHCKGGPHRDKKKEARRTACREELQPGEESAPGFIV